MTVRDAVLDAAPDPAADAAAERAPRRGAERNTARIERLNTASARRLIDPEVELDGHVGDGQVAPDELLSVYGLDLGLTREQLVTLSREETASTLAAGIRFEATLMASFALLMSGQEDLTDPRTIYELHEIGEETRHSRVFARLIQQLAPTAKNPIISNAAFRVLQRHSATWLITRPATMTTMILAGEEIPDLIQKKAAEHPDTDPYLRAVNLYHRQEEARHLSYARMVVGEHYARTTASDRFAVRHVAPLLIEGLFQALVHPGVYATVGLDPWKTVRMVRRSPHRLALKHEAIRPIVGVLLEQGVFPAGRVPKGWQRVAAVDRHGEPVPATSR